MIPAATQFSTTNAGISLSSLQGLSYKYEGLIQQPLTKVLRNTLFYFISYMDSIVPIFRPMHYFISAWRLVQIWGLSTCAAYSDLWAPGIPQDAMSIVSILFHIVPASYRKDCANVVNLILVSILGIIYLIWFLSALYLKKYAKLPKSLVYFIYIMISSALLIIPPVMMNNAGESISRLITKVPQELSSIGVIIVLIIVVVFCILTYTAFKTLICSSLIFRPMSLQTVLPTPQNIMIALTLISTFSMAIGSKLDQIPRIICMCLSLLVTVYGLKVPFAPGTIIRANSRIFFIAISISSIINHILFIIYVAIERQATQIELFILILIFAISYLAAYFIHQRFITKKLLILDDVFEVIENTDDFLNIVRTSNNMISLLCIGMELGHPAIQNWKIFSKASEAFPECSDVWVVYGKFVAIFPQEFNLLGYVIHNMAIHKFKGFSIRQNMMQAFNIQMQRECTLTPQLKHKLTLLSKSVSQAKTKLRHVWDIVIQGNTKEMENAVNASYLSIQKCENEFLHAITQYPNNRFIARAYTRFLLEVTGNHEKFIFWKDKTNAMKNGVLAHEDLTHILGIDSFPLLNEKAVTMISPTAFSGNNESEILTGFESEICDDIGSQVNYEQTSLIAEKIDKLTYPALRCQNIWIVLCFILFIIGMTMALLFYIQVFIQNNSVPLDFMYNMALIQLYNFMMPLFTHHYIMENIPQSSEPNAPKYFSAPKYGNIDLLAFGMKTDTRSQLDYIVNSCSLVMEKLVSFHNFDPTAPTLKKARSLLFDSIIQTKYYINETSYKNVTSSLQSIMYDTVVLISELLIDKTPSTSFFYSTLKSPNLLNSFMTCQDLNENISQVLDYLEEYVTNFAANIKNYVYMVEIAVCVALAIMYIITIIVVLYKIQKNKDTVYKCLTALPKNVVSSVSESLRLLNKNGESSKATEVDTELSKQEDSMLKMFATASDSNSTFSTDNIYLIVYYTIFGVITIFLVFILLNMLPSISSTLVKNAPHISKVLGTSTYMMSVEVSFNDAIAGNFGYPFSEKNIGLGGRNLTKIFLILSYYIGKYYDSYHSSKFGTEDRSVLPYENFNSHILSINTSKQCPNRTIPTTTVREAIDCLTINNQIQLFTLLVRKFSIPYMDKTIGGDVQKSTFDPQGELFSNVWYLIMKMYAEVFFPMFSRIVSDMESLMKYESKKHIPLIVVVIILSFIVMCLIIHRSHDIKTKLDFTLRLLLQCNPTVVTSTVRVVDVLNGNFNQRVKDATLRDKAYYDLVLKEVPDVTIVADQNFKITDINLAFVRLFPDKAECILNSDIRAFFKDNRFVINELTIANNSEEIIKYKNEDDPFIYLQTKVSLITQTYVVTMRDVSQTVSYNQLIKEEHSKSDKLLASILPPNLVSRVQSGEKNISFSVPSASILFMDIVEFTPWCASGTAAGVMSTLNLMYKYFDSALSHGKTLTKIKCIGDCYMAAGGIFTEMNQPAIHAKEAVEFGLSAIESIEQLNKEKNESLKIRVGINTGGPIVAGVLGTEKPTFEILGPAINMAQQMEHNGMPMLVHISRSVYELIYSGSFKIKERGQISIKNGKVVTYLVEGKVE
ncbi:Adenylate and Guanylate cyclase catalytic domain containing protein [Tritrichomonas foetus]|uniref:Adenylate and Guanylate cyclase catalytic domain containing protein n=1 Tax=Tritrichomonas foetus TaxID=1144522 RepID=A0A1J4KY20_9EUKA|nr:Adenylate and Guanylate cyclase catalytic domain containing protein [Tritrichomonas foetus]|eukprot:OHT15784.1 Adenylate and Guanylate cyclase catalytic domain containing protein [Tritrichomonas foetus]